MMWIYVEHHGWMNHFLGYSARTAEHHSNGGLNMMQEKPGMEEQKESLLDEEPELVSVHDSQELEKELQTWIQQQLKKLLLAM